jgi:hypothetical protein
LTFEPQEEKPEVVVPPYSFSLQYTKFPKALTPEMQKYFGTKAAGKPHMDYIGNNPSICRELYGLGYSINQRFGNQGLYTEFSNHIWIPQTNELTPHERMSVCMDCGSLIMNEKFYAYTDLK